MKVLVFGILFPFLISLSNISHGQNLPAIADVQQKKYKPLKVGDEVPDVQLLMVNYNRERINLSDFRGKVLILDLWATWCQPCIAYMPKTIELNKKFEKKALIIPVTYEDKALVKPFLDKLNKFRNIEVGSAVNDLSIRRLFPYTSVPRYIWINSKGIYQGSSFPDMVTEANIDAFVKNDRIQLNYIHEANDSMSTAVRNITFNDVYKAIGTDSLLSEIVRDSTIASFRFLKREFNPASITKFQWGRNYIAISNNSLLGLYKIAYGEGVKFFARSTTRLITGDSSIFTDNYGPGHYDVQFRMSWIREHGINCIIKTSNTSESRKWEILRESLKEDYPDISARIIKENVQSLVLKKENEAQPIVKSMGSGVKSATTDAFSIKINNASMSTLTSLLIKPYQLYRIYDETGFKGKIDVNIEADIANLDQLNNSLKKYNLKMEKEMREIEILVVTDNANLSEKSITSRNF